MTQDQIPITELRYLTSFIEERFGMDFRNYAMSSFNRRVLYVMDRNRVRDIQSLCKRLETEEDFFPKFARDLTVNTTEMFRDPEMWSYLRTEVLPRLANRKTIRIWHSACSSGEEVFAMAILLKEMGLAGKSKLYASDINTEILEKAQEGEYSRKRMEVNSENYLKMGGESTLKEYCVAPNRELNCRMDPALITSVRYFQHDLTSGEAPGLFDLILCRNVLIYFNKDLQSDVLELLHKSLVKDGFLILGAKETLRWSSVARKFNEISREEKVFQRIKE